MSRFHRFLSAIARISAAILLTQMLYLQFTAAPISVDFFTSLGLEPAGRISTGILQAIAIVLLLLPRMALYGALLALLVTGILIYFQVSLGLQVKSEGARLFAISVLLGFCCLSTLYMHLGDVPFLRRRRKPKVI